jgi:multiple sugar transport system permease protein
VVVVGSVIVFPWVFTVWMSMHEWTVGGARNFTGLANYARLASDTRFIASIGNTLIYTFLAVILPLFFGTFAALIFNSRLPFRGVLRGLFVMPMMATPVAIALVWTMMFHPQLGVLNYLLSFIGIGPQEWVFNPRTVIPSLVLVETSSCSSSWAAWRPFPPSLMRAPRSTGRMRSSAFGTSPCR